MNPTVVEEPRNLSRNRLLDAQEGSFGGELRDGLKARCFFLP
jgi:hypothetical protein